LLEKIQWRLKSPFQHGAQDDYNAPDNPNVVVRSKGSELPTRFMVFNLGQIGYYSNPNSLNAEVYKKYRLDWPYNYDGEHRAFKRK